MEYHTKIEEIYLKLTFPIKFTKKTSSVDYIKDTINQVRANERFLLLIAFFFEKSDIN